MAAPSTPSQGSVFERSDRYRDLNQIALETKPAGTFEGDVFAVAVLYHEKDASNAVGSDFIWFKVKSKHSVSKLCKAYHARTGVEVTFRYGGSAIEDHTQMRQLNPLSGNTVVFTSHKDDMEPASTPSTLSSQSQNRTPLGPSSAQLTNVPLVATAAVEKPLPKQENAYLSPYQSVHGQSLSPAAGLSSPQVTSSARAAPPPPSHQVQVQVQCENEGAYLGANGFARCAGNASPFDRGPTGHPVIKPEDRESNRMAESMPDVEDTPTPDAESSSAASSNQPSTRDRDNARLQKLIGTGSPETLEAEVKQSIAFLNSLKAVLVKNIDEHKDLQYFTQQIETLRSQNMDTPTIIGVVGNTGAGKSSVINAMLDEERLVPTNCMRACTAVVTEMSWNTSNDVNSKYRAEIEFIQPSDWEKDLRISLKELLDMSGNVTKDLSPDSEAGIAWAKIRSVYPNKSKDDIARSTVEGLLNEPRVKAVLGTTKKITEKKADPFYKALQVIIDSKEKATGDSKKKEKWEKRNMEFWPLIKVVRIYTKAEALSTGAVIVDLPGVHDSNAARAAVAAGYMKQCTGLWIVAPINRAVDDKAAKSLLGESFKRQLKYDGTYSRISFICSKTDDISITEASESLGLEDQFESDWATIDQIEEKQRTLKRLVADLKTSRSVYVYITNDAEDTIEVWDKLKEDLDDGITVYAPSDKSKKRKRLAESKGFRKKPKKSKGSHSYEDLDDFIDDDDSDADQDEEEKDPEAESDSESFSGEEPLTKETIEEKLAELKENKKRARREKAKLDTKVNSAAQELNSLEKNKSEIEARMRAVCIQGRNSYSKGAIQQDFAAGIKELDMESLQENEDFNPDEMDNVRDYDEVARSLPVFCVSSRAAQKLSNRLQKESEVAGFGTLEETEIPQLKSHCMRLTEAGRAVNCRRFLTSFSQLLTSLCLWAGNDGTGLNLSEREMQAETGFLKNRLSTLEKSLDKAVQDCLHDMNQALAENIFENYDHVCQLAFDAALPKVQHWHSPVNRDNHELGGYYWSTYKAIMRRDGVFANSRGLHDFNRQLMEPIMVHLANHWEKVFAQRLPRVLQTFSNTGKLLLDHFHIEVEARSMKAGAGVAGIALLKQQLRNYEAMFQELAAQMGELVNSIQREANREFTPVIARNLSAAYDWCEAETGSGQYLRMKRYMSDHVESHRGEMFRESCQEVKQRLTQMLRDVKLGMTDKTDEVFMCMSRDYMEIVAGKRPTGQVMPKWERQIRAAIRQAIEDREKRNLEAAEAEKSGEETVKQAAADAGRERPAEEDPA